MYGPSMTLCNIPILPVVWMERVVGQVNTQNSPGFLATSFDLLDMSIADGTSYRIQSACHPRPCYSRRRKSHICTLLLHVLEPCRQPGLQEQSHAAFGCVTWHAIDPWLAATSSRHWDSMSVSHSKWCQLHPSTLALTSFRQIRRSYLYAGLDGVRL